MAEPVSTLVGSSVHGYGGHTGTKADLCDWAAKIRCFALENTGVMPQLRQNLF
ncbi:hypothetical protein [Candidatus Williamhamiltonella defendens]|uniref:hypothetical protein n=1 Tax=Candidatus Williamhamiltonella defendens TaxID=138072 RepID=UPI001650E6E8|nr:hypothetical protein [Candidatus Hamiltonella defensa]